MQTGFLGLTNAAVRFLVLRGGIQVGTSVFRAKRSLEVVSIGLRGFETVHHRLRNLHRGADKIERFFTHGTIWIALWKDSNAVGQFDTVGDKWFWLVR